MYDRLNSILSTGKDLRDELRYILNSGHDDQIANLIWWLQPYQYNFTDIPYASTITFELSYNQTCLNTVKDSSCFTVIVSHDGRPLLFSECLKMNLNRGS
jgi:hypothetical protein